MYQGKCQGCDNYGEVDDINLCDNCATELENQDIDWGEYKAERKAKKLDNEKRSIAILESKGIAYIKMKGASHYKIGHWNFWATTGKYHNEKTGLVGRGVFNLLKELQKVGNYKNNN